jgi:hypothetical protein
MSNATAGQLKVDGNGYNFGIALDATAAHLYHNSGARDLILGVNETEQMRLTPAGLLKFNSGYGSVVTAFGVRAWVNFVGTSTVSINASGNVSSITDNAVGNYTVNFATNMPDIDYSVSGITAIEANNNVFVAGATDAPTVSAFRLNTRTTGNANFDAAIVYVNFIR